MGSFSLGRVWLHCEFADHPGEMFLTCADVCANSGPSSEEMLHFGPMRHVSVPFWHAPGGADFFQKDRDAVPSRKVVVLRSLVNFRKSEVGEVRIVSDLRLCPTATVALQGYGCFPRVMAADGPTYHHPSHPFQRGRLAQCIGGGVQRSFHDDFRERLCGVLCFFIACIEVFECSKIAYLAEWCALSAPRSGLQSPS